MWTLLDILAAIAPIYLVTANLPGRDSSIREVRTVVKMSTHKTGESVPVAAV